MRWLSCACLIFLIMLATPTLSNAQTPSAGPPSTSQPPISSERLGISVREPRGWKRIDNQGNIRLIATFLHPASKSQIEVVGTHLINQDVAQVFFESIHESLKSANFKEVSAPTPLKIGEVNGQQSEFVFEHTGISLKVVIFSFVKKDAAFLVIGYFKTEERDRLYDAIKDTISSMRFS